MELDSVWADDFLTRLIFEEGELVFERSWSGSPCNSGATSVHRFEGRYFASLDSDSVFGPYESLREAVAEVEGEEVNNTTLQISSSEVGAADLVRSLEVDPEYSHEGQRLQVNGHRCVIRKGRVVDVSNRPRNEKAPRREPGRFGASASPASKSLKASGAARGTSSSAATLRLLRSSAPRRKAGPRTPGSAESRLRAIRPGRRRSDGP